MHAKTDSEVTSLAPFSPARFPPRAATNNTNACTGRGVIHRTVYYVQSSSRDSHDGETTIKGHVRALHSHAQPHGVAPPLPIPRRPRLLLQPLLPRPRPPQGGGEVWPVLLSGGDGPSSDDFRQMVRSMEAEPYCRPSTVATTPPSPWSTSSSSASSSPLYPPSSSESSALGCSSLLATSCSEWVLQLQTLSTSMASACCCEARDPKQPLCLPLLDCTNSRMLLHSHATSPRRPENDMY